MDTNNTDEKLSAIVQQINTETIARSHADATITGRLNALEKLVAEQGDDLAKKVTRVNVETEGLKRDVKALQDAQSVAALALEVSNIRSVLTQLIQALGEEDASDDDGEHTLEQVKAAYLAIVGGDADELTVAHIETADTVADDGVTYRLINSTQGRSWEIPKTLVAEVLAGEDE